MAPKPRNRASMDAEAVARLMALQEQEESPAESAADTPKIEPPSPPPVIQAEPPTVEVEPIAVIPEPPQDDEPEFDPGKVDGRTLRKTGREPFATRIKPETHATLRRIAYARRITMAEALEMAVASFDSHRKA